MINNKVTIIYASQTGTAKYLAEELNRKLQNYWVQTSLFAVDEYDAKQLPEEQHVLFLASTTGDGIEPTMMQKFWQFLLIKDLPTDSLSGVKFSIFGLGDSSYAKFNWTARKLRARLMQLGAGPELPQTIYGDEQHPCGVETEYQSWLEKVLALFKQRDDVQDPQPNIIIKVIKKDENTIPIQEYNTKFIGKERITPKDHSKNTTNYTFKSEQQYQPGDCLLIKPFNQESLVKQMAEYLNIDLELQIELSWNKEDPKSRKLPKNITYRKLLTEYLDLTSVPSRYFMRCLSKYAENELHKEKLEFMGSYSPEGIEEYYRYAWREKRNPCEILFDFQPCPINIGVLIDSLDLIRPREYSISSYQPGLIRITVALLEYTTKSNRKVSGFCGRYLDQLTEGEGIQTQIIKGTLRFPQDSKIPTIMVGPGTGLAPFISFLEFREKQDKVEDILFFGACYETKEFYFKDQFEKLKVEGRLALFTAFSRDQSKKYYVQNAIRDNCDLIKERVMRNIDTVKIMIAGTSRNMPQQVESAFEEILGKAVLQRLKGRKQFQIECW